MAGNPNLDALTPEQQEWWLACGQNLVPTVLVVCGRNGCRATVGEIRADETATLALMHHRHGERTVPYTPRQTEETLGLPPGMTLPGLAEQQERKFKALDNETLRYLPENHRVAKRYNAGDIVFPLDILVYVVCPEHGMLNLLDPDRTVADLRDFIRKTKFGTKRRFFAFRAT